MAGAAAEHEGVPDGVAKADALGGVENHAEGIDHPPIASSVTPPASNRVTS